MKKTQYHFIGIGGIGMSALAKILIEKNFHVSGSDLNLSAIISTLKEKGAIVKDKQCRENICGMETVIYSSDIKPDNEEFLAAQEKKCLLLHRSQLLAHLLGDSFSLLVAGTHGKTTTSSLLAAVLMEAGMDPTYAIGGLLNGTNGKLGQSSFFVAEADESDGSFLKYTPRGAIITNVEPEHLDYYGTSEKLNQAFEQFINSVKEKDLLFWCGDDQKLTELTKGQGISYGFSKHNKVQIHRFMQQGWNCFFDLKIDGKCYENVSLNLIGKHQVLNATAVFAMSLQLGISEEHIRNAFQKFPGVGRRCEKRGEVQKVLFLDDYAHHPTEISTTLKAVKEAVGERRVIAVFQPHRYSRFRNLFDDFIHSFDNCDLLVTSDIYNAREQPIEEVSIEKFNTIFQKEKKIPLLHFSKQELVDSLSKLLRPHDVLITFGAGDITKIHPPLLEKVEKEGIQKYRVGLIFGGKSSEHEISLRSAKFVFQCLNKDLYKIELFAIDKRGYWHCGNKIETILQNCISVPSENGQPLVSADIISAICQCDLFFPVLHGPYGEDGTLQGFFELLGKPYAGPNYRASAITMDKILTKKLVSQAGISTPSFVHFDSWQWRFSKEALLKKCHELKYPLFVKPSRNGSSVGITCVEKAESLEQAIELAFCYDFELLIEEGKVGCRELEFAVMGNHPGRIFVPAPGEKLAEGSIVSYEMKYGQNAVKTTVNPSLSEELLQKGKELALKAYLAAGSSGMTRVDFLLDAEGQFWFFEMNSIPGLTVLSLFPKIWDREGVNGMELMDWLIIFGLERNREINCHGECNIYPNNLKNWI